MARRKRGRKKKGWEIEGVKRNYYNISKPGSYAGIKKATIPISKKSKKELRNQYQSWLKDQSTHLRFTQPKKIQAYSSIMSPKINYMWDADLMDMHSLARYNEGCKFVLLCIDIFSRQVYTKELKSKSADHVSQAFEEIFVETKPRILRTDAGKEFTASKVQEIFKENKIKHYIAFNQGKASYAERAIRTVKNKLTKYLYHKKTYKWVDVLQKATSSYNNTVHSSIGIEPNKVTSENSKEIFDYQYTRITKKDINLSKLKEKSRVSDHRYKVGDNVRLAAYKGPFTKDYDPKWTDEIYKVTKASIRDGIPVYDIEDLKGEEIKGSFYGVELQPAKVEQNKQYDIDEILKERTVNGRKEYFVSFKNYPSKFNDWVQAKNVKDLK